jgi:hypothetical protein
MCVFWTQRQCSLHCIISSTKSVQFRPRLPSDVRCLKFEQVAEMQFTTMNKYNDVEQFVVFLIPYDTFIQRKVCGVRTRLSTPHSPTS